MIKLKKNMKYLICTIFTIIMSNFAFTSPCFINISLMVENFASNKPFYYVLQESDITEMKFNVKIKDKVYLKGEILDCRGALKFELTDSGKNVIIYGQFTNGLDTLKGQGLIYDPTNNTGFIKVTRYFESLPDGIWKYKNLKGKLLNEKIFYKGIPDFMKK